MTNPTAIADELKSCPFCGGNEVTIYNSSNMFHASCRSCGLEAPTETGVTHEDAVKYWNTRSLLHQPPDAREVLQIELDNCRNAVATITSNRTGSTTQNRNLAFYEGKVAGLDLALHPLPNSAPELGSSQNTAERDSSVMADYSGAETFGVRELCAHICELHAEWAESKIEGGDPASSTNQMWACMSNTANDLAEMIRKDLPPLSAALSSPVSIQGTWQSIDTAPRDGTRVWIYVSEFDPNEYVASFGHTDLPNDHPDYWEGWLFADEILVNHCADELEPTHWQPLPEPPARGAGGE